VIVGFTPLSSVFFPPGVGVPFKGVPDGDGLGIGDGLEDATGIGVVTGLTGSGVFGSQAPNTATLAARRVEIINDLLIVFSSY